MVLVLVYVVRCTSTAPPITIIVLVLCAIPRGSFPPSACSFTTNTDCCIVDCCCSGTDCSDCLGTADCLGTDCSGTGTGCSYSTV